MKPYARVAFEFATALVDGDFSCAAAMLAPDLRRMLSPEALRNELYGMFRGYSPSGEPREAHHDEEFTMEQWPGKQPGDVGWAYVGITGDGFVEAVTVVVADIGGQMLIRDIEWGRP